MNALLHRVWAVLGIDILDRCHVAQPAATEMLAAAGPRLTAAGLNLSEREILDLMAELLTADEPPAPQALSDQATPAASRAAVPTAAPRPRARVCDADCREAITVRPNLIVPWLLMAGYAYHHLDAPILSDGYWDELCHLALTQWDSIEHRHKHLVGIDDLTAGSLYALPEDAYPRISRSAARRILREGVVKCASGYLVVEPLPLPPAPPPPPRSAAPAKPAKAKPARRPTGGPQQLSLF